MGSLGCSTYKRSFAALHSAQQFFKESTDSPESHLALLSADIAEHEVLRRGIHLQVLHIYGHQRLHRDMQGQGTWQQ